MAFGNSMKEKQKAQGDGEKTVFVNQWVDPQRGLYRTGRRQIRLLPEVDENGVLVPGENGNGVTASEVAFAEFWIPVNVGDRERQQRVIVSADNPFDNPVWNRLYADLPKEIDGKLNPKRVLPKRRFALNVFDRTKVITVDGFVVYPNDQDKYFMLVEGKPVEVKGTPKPHNAIRVLEGSHGKVGGKHLFAQLIDYVGTVSNPNDETERKLDLHEFDLTIKITGEGVDTRRTIQLASNFKPLTAEDIALPRYNLTDWAKPWPNAALDALLDGDPLNEVLERYPEIVVFPTLPTEDAEIPF